MCDKRIPPLLEESFRAPTPLAEAIFNMIVRPFKLLRMFITDDDLYSKETIKCALLNLTKSFFSIPFTEQVEFFIIPALAREEFPHGLWTSVLNEAIKSDKEKLWNVNSSCWLLYSFLKLCNFSTDSRSTLTTTTVGFIHNSETSNDDPW